MFAHSAKRVKYERPDGTRDMPPPPGPTEGEQPPPAMDAQETPPKPLKADKRASIVVVALDEMYKDDSAGPGFIACLTTPGGDGATDTYSSADKGGIFAPMDVEGSIVAQFPTISMESASSQLLVTPEKVIVSQQNHMAALAKVQVGLTVKTMLVVAVIVTPETRQYLIDRFLTQLMDQRFCIVGQLMEEVFKGEPIFSIALYKGVLSPTDFTPTNLTTLELQLGNIKEKMWDGKQIALTWVKAGYAAQHKDIEACLQKEKLLLEQEGDKLTLKGNTLAVVTEFAGGNTQDLPGLVPLK